MRPVTHNLPPQARVPCTATESESPSPLEIDFKYLITKERVSAAWGPGLAETEQREGNKTVSWMKEVCVCVCVCVCDKAEAMRHIPRQDSFDIISQGLFELIKEDRTFEWKLSIRKWQERMKWVHLGGTGATSNAPPYMSVPMIICRHTNVSRRTNEMSEFYASVMNLLVVCNAYGKNLLSRETRIN